MEILGKAMEVVALGYAAYKKNKIWVVSKNFLYLLERKGLVLAHSKIL